MSASIKLWIGNCTIEAVEYNTYNCNCIKLVMGLHIRNMLLFSILLRKRKDQHHLPMSLQPESKEKYWSKRMKTVRVS